ncbi:hypothetical protein M422DRAFT_196412 [Sphaerobolus stellatus SS14]|uniref:Integrase catalytic domain-containing protein n=1 Tax=Sphaerobolus stellatus (strain SS14) TaxID=990650 RepID=A0A0C9U1X0_SPHS4|nr:hypothetical protein M422DRAFT_196412 [Sphaerobolus stellatus SS14]
MSRTPLQDEWIVRNAWTLGIIVFNTTNPVGLGIDMSKTAAEVWKSLLELYDVKSDLAIVNAERELRNVRLTDNDDFPTHIATLRTKWSIANAAGANISDTSFRMIVLTSLPSSWDSYITTLFDSKTSAEVVTRLNMYWMQVSRSKTPGANTTVFQTNTKPPRERPQCSNCKKRGHTIEVCYWKGGGKEGQFPPGFGKRGGESGNVQTASQGQNTKEREDDIRTYADSGATDHCFVNRADFSSYTELHEPREGQPANKQGKFRILGYGTVMKTIISAGYKSSITFKTALHTPDLAANLVSVSKFDGAGFSVLFGSGKATFMDKSGSSFMIGEKINELYLLQTVSPVMAMTAKSHEKPTSLDTWHRRFGHAGVTAIKNMIRHELVDGLEVTGEASVNGLCEDCIYGKQTQRPYDEKVTHEMELLERVHIDLHGPTRVRSFGGAWFMMLITDGASSYRTVYFLSEKSAAASFQAFKQFHAEAERQTGKKLREVRLDMGREWYNETWESYCQEKGIILISGAPYAHQQNGVSERANRIIINGTRCLLADTGLPPSLWAELAATTVYLVNFIPSARHPGKIPVEVWTGKRQDVSHLRAIGSIAFAHIPPEVGHSKLAPRSIKYTLIGYYGRDAYRLYDRSSKLVIKARNVIFEEGEGHHTPNIIPVEEVTDDFLYPQLKDNPPTPPPNTPLVIPNKPGLAPRPRESDPPLHPPIVLPEAISDQPDGGPRLRTANKPPVLRRSTRTQIPTKAVVEAAATLEREKEARTLGKEWATNSKHPEAHHVDIDGFLMSPNSHVAFMQSRKDPMLPRNYKEAMLDAEVWKPAMDEEMLKMRERGVWEVVDPPPGANILPSMWLYANKYDGDGNIIRRKARFLVLGNHQRKGIDFGETHADVVRMESFRIAAATAVELNLHTWQVDFVAAYLNSENKFDTYVRPAPGYLRPGEEGKVWKALRSVYGTMFGGYDWADDLENSYEGLGYYQSLADPCIHSRYIDEEYTLTSTYTDDVFGASSTEKGAKKAVEELERCYELKDAGSTGQILGIKVERDMEKGTLRLSQRAFMEEMLQEFGLKDCVPKYTPLPVGLDLTEADGPDNEEDRAFMEKVPFRKALGKLQWLANTTRPDLAQPVNRVSRFQSNPGPNHWKAVRHIMAYVRGSLDYGILYSRGAGSGLKPITYVDADYGNCMDTRRSTGGYVVMMAGGPVSWSSKRQQTVALSTTEAEYMAYTRAAQQAVWMSSFMSEIGLPQDLPAIIYGDNASAIALAKNASGHARAKHIDIRHHSIRERIKKGQIDIKHVPSTDNLADIFTKQLPRPAYEKAIRSLGLVKSTVVPV